MKRKRVGIRQLKNEAPSILSEVREDETEYIVTRHGKPVALISPVSPEALASDQEDPVELALSTLRRTAEIVARSASGTTAPAVVSRQRR